MRLPKKINNEIEVLDKTEKVSVTIQPSQLWKLAKQYHDTITNKASLKISSGSSLTFLAAIVGTKEFNNAFGIKAPVWEALFILGFVSSVTWLIVNIIKHYQLHK